MAENKTKMTEASVDAYIATLPNDRKRKEAHQVLELVKEITKVAPRMWGPSIIGFDRMEYKHGHMPKLAFSPRKTNFVFYVIDHSDEQEELLQALGKYRTGKVCLYINKLADIDLDVLEKILRSSWNKVKEK